jgi:hypothetical protein
MKNIKLSYLYSALFPIYAPRVCHMHPERSRGVMRSPRLRSESRVSISESGVSNSESRVSNSESVDLPSLKLENEVCKLPEQYGGISMNLTCI